MTSLSFSNAFTSPQNVSLVLSITLCGLSTGAYIFIAPPFKPWIFKTLRQAWLRISIFLSNPPFVSLLMMSGIKFYVATSEIVSKTVTLGYTVFMAYVLLRHLQVRGTAPTVSQISKLSALEKAASNSHRSSSLPDIYLCPFTSTGRSYRFIFAPSLSAFKCSFISFWSTWRTIKLKSPKLILHSCIMWVEFGTVGYK